LLELVALQEIARFKVFHPRQEVRVDQRRGGLEDDATITGLSKTSENTPEVLTYLDAGSRTTVVFPFLRYI
jgi:hypothetical protein